MKLQPAAAGVVMGLLVAAMLSVAWRLVACDVLPAPLENHWLAEVAICFISILAGVWYYIRRKRNISAK